MKRIGNLYEEIISIENLVLAEKKASRGKSKNYDVVEFNKNKEKLLIKLRHVLKEQKFKTSEYYYFKLKENNKERDISKLPYYPDRIVHHSILNILEPIFVNCFISQTYACIKYRGIHKCLRDLNKDISKNKYCLKIDIKKFYPSVDNEILKSLLRKKFKDEKLLNLLNNIIDSHKGLPLGNYTSQFLANFYLTYFDHYCKEKLRIKYFFRYCDDIVILENNKKVLHHNLYKLKIYLSEELSLELNRNYQIYPINKRGIDFVGYVSYPTHIKLRKQIKKNFIRMIKHYPNSKSINSYLGWLKYSNSINLQNKYIK